VTAPGRLKASSAAGTPADAVKVIVKRG